MEVRLCGLKYVPREPEFEIFIPVFGLLTVNYG